MSLGTETGKEMVRPLGSPSSAEKCALDDDLADHTSAACDCDHLAEKVAIDVVDLLAPQLARLEMCDQHVNDAMTQGVNRASTIGGVAVESLLIDR